LWPSLVILFLFSCAGVGKRLEPPRVTLANIRVEEIRPFESKLLVELRVFNTNDVTLEIKGIDCEVELNDRQFASGVSNTKTTISPFDSATIPINVYSSVFDVAVGLLTLKDQDKLRYKVKGRVHLAGDFFGPPVVSFESDGEVSIRPPTNQD
jgi:LEA14-like dessication related protein